MGCSTFALARGAARLARVEMMLRHAGPVAPTSAADAAALLELSIGKLRPIFFALVVIRPPAIAVRVDADIHLQPLVNVACLEIEKKKFTQVR